MLRFASLLLRSRPADRVGQGGAGSGRTAARKDVLEQAALAGIALVPQGFAIGSQLAHRRGFEPLTPRFVV